MVGRFIAVGLKLAVGLAMIVLHDDATLIRTKRIVILTKGFRYFIMLITTILLAQRLTVCVTRAGAGSGTPSDWKKAEA